MHAELFFLRFSNIPAYLNFMGLPFREDIDFSSRLQRER